MDSDAIALVADERPVEADVDSDATELLVVLRPVDSEPMPVEVDVDSDAIALVADERPVEADVDSESTARFVAFNCEPLIASVLDPLIRPAATLVI